MLVQTPEALMPLEKAMAREWTGKTPDEFDSEVIEFFETVKSAKYATNFKELVYKPILELFDLLRDYEYRVFVCSGEVVISCVQFQKMPGESLKRT